MMATAICNHPNRPTWGICTECCTEHLWFHSENGARCSNVANGFRSVALTARCNLYPNTSVRRLRAS